MKFYFLFIPFIFSIDICSAQNNSNTYQQLVADSMKRIALSQAALDNPGLRQILISTDIISKGKETTDLNHTPLFKGEAQTIRTNILFNIPVKSWGKNSISASTSFFQEDLRIGNIQNISGSTTDPNLNFNKFTVGLSFTFQRRDSLFGKPVFYMASFSGLTDDANTIKKINYLASAILMFQQTATTRVSAGLLINIDPSVSIPFFPIFSYWHQFDNKLELNITIPTGGGFRKNIAKNLWATLGTSLSGSVAFLYLNYPNIPHDVNYTTLDLKNGFGIEYRLGKRFILGANGGILTPISSRAFERDHFSRDYFLDNKLSDTPYLNFSFSVLPFL